jgi:hypothetical protein
LQLVHFDGIKSEKAYEFSKYTLFEEENSGRRLKIIYLCNRNVKLFRETLGTYQKTRKKAS